MEFDFQVKSGKVNLSDPCYTTDTRCGLYDVPARNGNWHVEVEHTESFGRRVSHWFTFHTDFWSSKATSPLKTHFGVDSGQFGIFDSEIYDAESGYDQPGFYRDCCDITLTKDSCGVVNEQGFVSSSGYGDGGYVGWGAHDDDGNLVKFHITFIGEEEDEWDEEEEEDEWDEE